MCVYVYVYILKTNKKPVALNPVITMQPQRTELMSLNLNFLSWDNDGNDGNSPLKPLVKELVNCKTSTVLMSTEMGSGQIRYFYPRTHQTTEFS